MRIAINALAHVAGGGITYLKNLLPKLAELDKENEYYILIRKSLGNLELSLPDNFELIRFDLPSFSLLSRVLFEQVVLPFWLARKGVHLLYCPTDTVTLLSPCPVVLAIRNPNPYSHLTFKSSGLSKYKFKVQKVATKLSSVKAKQVIFVSDWSRNIVCNQLRIPSHKSSTVYHGIDRDMFEEMEKDFIEADFKKKVDELGNYILSVSTINPHKNYEALLKAYAHLQSDLKKNYKLVIAGRNSSPKYFSSLKSLVTKLGIKDKVSFLGEVKYENIPYLYQKASLFVLPSLLETFGHTLVESMASKTPLLAAGSTVIPEIAGDAALLFDPKKPKELAEKITEALTNPELRQELVEKGSKRVKDFSWKKTAKKTLEVFERAASKGF